MKRLAGFQLYPVLAMIAALLMAQPALAQGDRAEFDETMRQWKAAFLELEQIRIDFRYCDESEQYELRDRFQEVKKQGDVLRRKAIDQAATLYAASPQIIPDLQAMLQQLPQKLYDSHDYELAARTAAALIRHDSSQPQLIQDAIRWGFFANQYDLASNALEQWKQQQGAPPEALRQVAAVLPDYRDAWEKEQQRRTESAANPLPRFVMETDQGNIVVELYEDDWPQVVGNLVSLLEERKLYEDSLLFEVIEHQTVRGGCARNNGQSAVPVARIGSDEDPAARGRHFRGTFSLAVVPGDNLAITQFSIQRIPIPDFDGRSLVVGYVVEGMDVVDSLAATHTRNEMLQVVPVSEAVPVQIKSVRVIQKRDHPYTFEFDAPPPPGTAPPQPSNG